MASTELRAAAQQAQPKALRLADALEMSSNHGIRREAAAELRRLYAERTAADGVINDLAAKVRGLQTQRDALLEALQDLCDEQEGPPLVRRHRQWQAAIDKARAAIAKAEENT